MAYSILCVRNLLCVTIAALQFVVKSMGPSNIKCALIVYFLFYLPLLLDVLSTVQDLDSIPLLMMWLASSTFGKGNSKYNQKGLNNSLIIFITLLIFCIPEGDQFLTHLLKS